MYIPGCKTSERIRIATQDDEHIGMLSEFILLFLLIDQS